MSLRIGFAMLLLAAAVPREAPAQGRPAAASAAVEPAGTPDLAAVQGFIGKATSEQRRIEPLLEAMEASTDIDRPTFEEAVRLHASAARFLTLAGNVGWAIAWPKDVQGWYFAAATIQKENTYRLTRAQAKLTPETGGDSTAASETTSASESGTTTEESEGAQTQTTSAAASELSTGTYTRAREAE